MPLSPSVNRFFFSSSLWAYMQDGREVCKSSSKTCLARSLGGKVRSGKRSIRVVISEPARVGSAQKLEQDPLR
jgi:hypothetical protein